MRNIKEWAMPVNGRKIMSGSGVGITIIVIVLLFQVVMLSINQNKRHREMKEQFQIEITRSYFLHVLNTLIMFFETKNFPIS